MKRRRKLSMITPEPVTEQEYETMMNELCAKHQVENLEIKISSDSLSIKLKKSALEKVTPSKVLKIFKGMLDILH